MNRFRFCLALFCALACIPAYAHYLVVTPDQVVISEEGLFVEIDHVKLPVSSISSANSGFLVAIPLIEADICPRCGRDTYASGRFCRWCFFPDDGHVPNGA